MNFAYGVIIIVGVLAAGILGLIATSPDDIIQPRITSVEENLTACTMQWDPVCGIDGMTYGNLCMLGAADVKLRHEGECVPDMPEPVPGFEATPEPEEEPEPEVEPEPETLPMVTTISILAGVGVPGCEETTECYLPYEVTVAVGTTVTWSNDDNTVHTVTSGHPVSGIDELFDSGIFMFGDTFEFTFNDAGTFDYFCMVHPWMVGIVYVS